MPACRRQAFQRQAVQQNRQRLGETITDAGPGEGQGGQAGGGTGTPGDTQLLGFLADARQQGALAAEQACACLDFQAHCDGFEDRNAGCELKRPACDSGERITGRRRGVGGFGEQRDPQHGRTQERGEGRELAAGDAERAPIRGPSG